MVDQYSSLADVMKNDVVVYANISGSSDQWNYLTLYNAGCAVSTTCTATSCNESDKDYFKIGLFANDLATFKENCTTSDNCNVGDYYQFDGWAIGMYSKVSST